MTDAPHSDVPPRPSWGQRLWALVKAIVPTVLIFLVIGPVVGYFAIILPVAVTANDGPLGPIEGVLSALALLPLGALFGYMIGYGPAIITGTVVAVLDCLADLGEYRTPVAIAVGAGVTVALFYGVSDLPDRQSVETVHGAAAVAAAIGAMAAGVSAMVARRRVPSPPWAHTRQAGVEPSA